MPTSLTQILPLVFGLSAVIYLGLAIHVARYADEVATNSISQLLTLVAAFVAGAAFWYGATDLVLFSIGRVFTLFAAGFMPIAFYRLYRDYAGSPPSAWLLFAFSLIPTVTVGLSITNPVHGLVWDARVVDGIVRFSHVREHDWLRLVALPFSYSLFGYAVLALAGRLSGIARAHRGRIVMLLVCAVAPFGVNVGNTLLDIGPYDFPWTAATLVALTPLYAWAAISARVATFKPVAYQTLFNHVRDAIIVLDEAGRIVSANRQAQEVLGDDEQALIGRRLRKILPAAADAIGAAEASDLAQTVRLDSDRFLDITSAPLSGPNGESQGCVVVCHDITERRKTLRALSDSEHLIRSLVEHSSNGMLRFARLDGQYRCTYANRAAENFLDAEHGALVDTPLEDLDVLDPARLIAHFAGKSGATGGAGQIEREINSSDGSRWMRTVAEPVGNDFSITLVDITRRKHEERKMLAEALRDSLTGLLNRRGFEAEAPALFDEHDQGAVIYVDLDGFKATNDRYGHRVGDALLKAFAHRLAVCLRPEDIVARLGGDEFAIVLPGISAEDARHVAARLVNAATEAYIIEGQDVRCPASVGIALKPEHGTRLWDLISLADRAMYSAKKFREDEAANDGVSFAEASASS